MNIVIFSLQVILLYVIIMKAYSAWKKADIKEKMNKIQEVEENYSNVMKFKKTHKTNLNKEKEVINQFTKE